MTQPPAIGPGWYPALDQAGMERWWDGQQWTPAVRQLPQASAGTATAQLPVIPAEPIQHQTQALPAFVPPITSAESATKRRKWPWIVGAAVAFFVILGLIGSLNKPPATKNTAGTAALSTASAASTSTSTTTPAPPSSVTPTNAATTAAAVTDARNLPNMVGKGLQYAQDAAQAAGFYVLKSHDASGRDRLQILDRDWVVCTQTPKAGHAAIRTTVDFGVVKVGEICPGADQGTTAPTPAGAVMPNLIGKSGKVVEETLPNASLTFNDGSGQGRAVIIASNWQVCATSPKPGEAYGGVPVTVTVVKYGESCG